jgi:2-polyprenyl-3-methyl-5-hydroxy-6-metoxy-1,4-benzoquinol methylase
MIPKNKSNLCPICQSICKKYSSTNFPLFRCTNCTLIFQNPVASSKPNKQQYKSSNYFTFWGDKQNRADIHLIKKSTAKILLNELCKVKEFHAKNKLLDVGIATGALLEEAKSFGFQTYGIEPNSEFAKIAKQNSGARIYVSFFENTALLKDFFSAVVFFDSLEHMQKLKEIIRKTFSILKKNGIMAVSTPDTNSLSFKILGPFWPHFKSEHLYYFNSKSLQYLLTDAGFKIILFKPSLKSLSFGYLKSYFETFKIPLLSFLAKIFFLFLPQAFCNITITIPSGNLLLFAKKE